MPDAPPPTPVTLAVVAGPHAGREFVFDHHDTFLVGRTGDCHFQLSYDDPYFSRRHFLVEVNPPRVRVYDLNSRNGIAVNGKKVRTADLADGDQLKAGHTVFLVRASQSDPNATVDVSATSANEPAPAVMSAAVLSVIPVIPGYALESRIGRGAMGIVYRAVRLADGQAVAVKIIAPAAGVSRRDVERFLRETAILARLDHPHIVRYYTGGEHAGLLYLVMELATGPDLRQRVKEQGPLEVSMAVRLMLHVLDGLAHAHEQGFIHRDIKPANLLLHGPKKSLMVKVADFGLARAYNECNISGLTMQGEFGGSPAFMPPEQVTHFREAKPAADQYSAAATLYYLLTGRYVLDLQKTTQLQMVQLASEPRVPIRARRADLPEILTAVIHKALSLDPSDRFADVQEFRESLRPFA